MSHFSAENVTLPRDQQNMRSLGAVLSRDSLKKGLKIVKKFTKVARICLDFNKRQS